ncbi:MAG: polysaccharide biosynthesis/export family protein [Nitrospiraceae bacterium]
MRPGGGILLRVVSGCLALVLLGGAACQKDQVEYSTKFAAPTEFLIGPEDVLVVNVWRNQELSKDVIVRPDGKISMPLIGDVPAAGLTAQALSKRISDGLAEFMANPTVSVTVKEINSYYIYVLGEVGRPGKFTLKSFATVLQGISYAGGFTQFAARNRMHVMRMVTNGHGEPKQVQIPVPYDDILAGKNLDANFVLRAGDVIVVP